MFNHNKLSFLPDKFLSEREFSLMFSFLESVPGFVNVRNEFAFNGEVGSLVVGAHLTLKGEQHDL